MDLKKDIGKNIRKARAKKKWSQIQLAKAAKKSIRYISQLENGQLNTTIDSLEQIAKTLDCRLIDLIQPTKGRKMVPRSLSSKSEPEPPEEIVGLELGVKELRRLISELKQSAK